MKSPAYWTSCGNLLLSSTVQEGRLYYFPDENLKLALIAHSKGIPMTGEQFFEFSCKAHRLTRLSPGLQNVRL